MGAGSTLISGSLFCAQRFAPNSTGTTRSDLNDRIKVCFITRFVVVTRRMVLTFKEGRLGRETMTRLNTDAILRLRFRKTALTSPLGKTPRVREWPVPALAFFHET